MLRNVLRDIANWQTKKAEQLYKSSVLAWMITISRKKNWIFKKQELETVGELSEVCPQIVLKCLYLVRNGRPDILWSVNKLARSVTNWAQAWDRRVAILISYIHHTSDYQQYCSVGNMAQHCRLGLGLKINLGRSSIHLRKQNICPYQLDV